MKSKKYAVNTDKAEGKDKSVMYVRDYDGSYGEKILEDFIKEIPQMTNEEYIKLLEKAKKAKW